MDDLDWASASISIGSKDEDTGKAKEAGKKTSEGSVSGNGWRIAGDNNLAKATQARVKDRDQIPKGEEEEFDGIKVAELRQRLKDKSLKTSGSKVELWKRLQATELRYRPKTESSKTGVVKGRNTSTGVRGNNNFTISAQRNAIGRDALLNKDRKEFDRTSTAELKAWLRKNGMKVSGRKIDLWRRWKERRDNNESEDEDDNEDGEDSDDESDDESDDASEGDFKNEIEDKEAYDEPQSYRSRISKSSPVYEEGMDGVSHKASKAKAVDKSHLKRRRDSEFPCKVDRRPVKHRVIHRSRPLPNISPIDYYIPGHLLDMTITKVLEVAPLSLREGPPPYSNDRTTLREYLQMNTEHRKRLAQLRSRGQGPFQHEEDCPKDSNSLLTSIEQKDVLNNELSSGFTSAYFSLVLDKTPAIWQLWDKEEQAGNCDLWRNRYTNIPERSGFKAAFLGKFPFLDLVQQYPLFLQFINNAIENGDLTLENPEDRTLLEIKLDK